MDQLIVRLKIFYVFARSKMNKKLKYFSPVVYKKTESK